MSDRFTLPVVAAESKRCYTLKLLAFNNSSLALPNVVTKSHCNTVGKDA